VQHRVVEQSRKAKWLTLGRINSPAPGVANVRAERLLKIPVEPSPELRISGAAAQTRLVSRAGIRLGSWDSARAFKGIICDDIFEFESHMPSHAVRSPSAKMRVVPTLPIHWRVVECLGSLEAMAIIPVALPPSALPPAAFDHEFDEVGWLAGAFDV
jgi:hypothetical protein